MTYICLMEKILKIISPDFPLVWCVLWVILPSTGAVPIWNIKNSHYLQSKILLCWGEYRQMLSPHSVNSHVQQKNSQTEVQIPPASITSSYPSSVASVYSTVTFDLARFGVLSHDCRCWWTESVSACCALLVISLNTWQVKNKTVALFVAMCVVRFSWLNWNHKDKGQS